MDRLTPEQRRKNMQHVKNKDSQIELALRRALWRAGFRYRKKDFKSHQELKSLREHKRRNEATGNVFGYVIRNLF